MQLSNKFIIAWAGIFIALSTFLICLQVIFNFIAWLPYDNIIIYFFYGLTSLIIILSILGIIGACQINRILLFLYEIAAIIFFLILLIITVISILAGFFVFKGTTCNTSTNALNQWIPQVANVTQKAQFIYGKTCRVYFPAFNNLNQNQKKQLSKQGFINFDLIKQDFPTTVQQCKDFIKYQYPKQLIKIPILMEKEFDCSGWCNKNNPPLYFLFSDINIGIPEKGYCYKQIKHFSQTYIRYMGIGFCLLTFLMLMNIFCTCWACFTGYNFYQKK